MATGYTEIVKERADVTFEDFAWRCARAFGAFVMQRDDSRNAPTVVVEEPDTAYYEELLAKIRARLSELETMSAADAERMAKKDFDEGARAAREINEHRQATRQRYEAMMAKVEAWEPPSKDHESMKKFMLDQLRDSLQFDCGGEPWAPVRLVGAEWRADELESAARDIAYYAKRIDEARERCAKRNAWVKALVESIGMPPKERKASP